MIQKNFKFINNFVNIYENYLEKLLDKNNIWTDQVILTHIFKDKKDIFHMLYSGYGEIFSNM